MMPDSEPVPERDKPRAIERSAPFEPNGATKSVRATGKEDISELDDFGLPVKKTKRRVPVSTAEEATISGSNRHELTIGYSNVPIVSPETVSSPPEQQKPSTPPQAPTDPAIPLTYENLEKVKSDEVAEPATGSGKIKLPESNILTKIANGDPIVATGGISEWSHQVLAPKKVVVEDKKEDDEWHDMPAYGQYDVYDDDGKLVARAAQDSEDEPDVYAGLGGAGKGYTRVQIDEDAKSATSMDENTSYLFKDKSADVVDEDEEQRDPLAQMQATKDLLTEGQRIAYVGVTRLAMADMVKELEDMEGTRATKKEMRIAFESMTMWSQKMMVRLYAHMEIDSSGMTESDLFQRLIADDDQSKS